MSLKGVKYIMGPSLASCSLDSDMFDLLWHWNRKEVSKYNLNRVIYTGIALRRHKRLPDLGLEKYNGDIDP
jgi:hypothetical protein